MFDIPVSGQEIDDQPLTRLATALRRTRELTRDRPRTGTSHEDADGTVGTVGTDDAIGFDPLALLEALHRAGARVLVIGQVAGILHGSRELTGDLDLLWDGDPAQAPALVEAFRSVGAELADDEGAALACDTDAFRLPKVVFSSLGASGDCCTPALPWGDLPVTEFLARGERAVSGQGFDVCYLRIEDLISMRRAVGRPKDLRRAEELTGLAVLRGP